jgi:hypothetical protein
VEPLEVQPQQVLPVVIAVWRADHYVETPVCCSEKSPGTTLPSVVTPRNAKGGGRELATAITPRPDYPKLVEAFGEWGQAVDHPAEIVPALQRGINTVQEGLPALLDVSLVW